MRSRAAAGNDAVRPHLPRQSSFRVGGRRRLDPVAEAVFNDLDVDGFFLNDDDEALGHFGAVALRAERQNGRARTADEQEGSLKRKTTSNGALMPRGGSTLISTGTRTLPPQCGFALTSLGNLLTEDQELRSRAGRRILHARFGAERVPRRFLASGTPHFRQNPPRRTVPPV